MRITKLGYALLSLLARGPLSGYDLARLMKRPLGFFWSARHSQIYPELVLLEKKGLVVVQVVEQQDRPDKKVYTITQAGCAVLKPWITQMPGPQVERNEMLLKVFSIWMADPEQAIELFQKQQQQHQAQLALYEDKMAKLVQKWGTKLPLDSPSFGDYITLQRGIQFERMCVEWCDWVIGLLEGQKEIKE